MTSIHRGQRWQEPLRPRRVLVLLLPDVHLQDMAGPVQVLYEASGLGGAYEITYCSELPRVRSTQGLVLADLATLPAPRRDDLVLVPGTLSTKLDRLNQLPRRWLREAHEVGAQLASVCSGRLRSRAQVCSTAAAARRTGKSSRGCVPSTLRPGSSKTASSLRTKA